MTPLDHILALSVLFSSKSFRYSSESELQEGLRQVLEAAVIPFVKEYRLTPKSRLDFLVYDSIAIEAKLDRSLADLTRQVHRYTLDPRVAGVLVVATRMRLQNLPQQLNDKPVRVFTLLANMF